MNVERYPENPLVTPAMIRPSRPDFEVVSAFNAGVAEYRGEILLLLRVGERPAGGGRMVRAPMLDVSGARPRLKVVEFRASDRRYDFSDSRVIRGPAGFFALTSISHLRIARSRDGRRFTVDPRPALVPDRPQEAYGVEDPRVTRIGDTYYIAYKGVAPHGITANLASTRDFRRFRKHGTIFCPENLDVAIFPEKVRGRFAALHRPVPKMVGDPNLWAAYSPDLLAWGDHRFVMGVRPGKWDEGRIGASAVPIRTREGWLEIYHGATRGDVYGLGVALLDLKEPHRVLARGERPILLPEMPYEKEGFFPNVVFSCGAAVRGDRVSVYYGAADWVMAGADFSLRELMGAL